MNELNLSFDETERSDLSLSESSKRNRSNSQNHSNRNDSRTQGSKKRKFVKLEDNPRAIYYLPRIPRNDVRRQYAMMFSNVYNSHDWDFMSKFVHTFFNPNGLILFQKYSDRSKYNEVECKGSENILQFWYDAIIDVPDLIFKPEKGQIKVRTDGTAVISSTFLVQGTIIDDMILPKSAIFEEIDKQLGPELYQDTVEPSSTYATNSERSNCLSAQDSVSTSSCSDFEKEFEVALNDYLNEEVIMESNEFEFQTFSSATSSTSSLMKDQKVFQWSGHFSFHLTADSIVHYGTYSTYSLRILS